MTYFECWNSVATALFAQALAGEPTLTEAEPDSDRGSDTGSDTGSGPASGPDSIGESGFGFEAVLSGDLEGSFAVRLDSGLLEAALMGEGADQKAGWQELLREVTEAAAGELLARTGRKCHVAQFRPLEAQVLDADSNVAARARLFALQLGERTWSLHVQDATREAATSAESVASAAQPSAQASAQAAGASVGASAGSSSARPAASPDANLGTSAGMVSPGVVSPGVELLLDVELDAALRFGCREMPLGEILDLGPGDVVELDRHIADPVDLIVGDKIVARGEVVLVNGNFGLRVTEVAEPRRRLESIRCLF